jgi:SAM-dependent methyltransferase
MSYEPNHQVCDYEGSAYRTEFWGHGRDYEDAVERVALDHLLPATGGRLIDIGGGYGRLVPLYSGYDTVVIFDYAMSQLRQAQELWGPTGPQGRPRYVYVAGDFYRLPFAPATFDTVVMVRTLHHAADAPSVLRGISEILAPSGSFVLEFANKRNLKAILRYLVGRQAWSPFDQEPVEFVSLNFDFHPSWIENLLTERHLRIRHRRAVSSFRIGLLKRLLPTQLLVTLDRLCQPLGGMLPLSPSVFLRCEREANRAEPAEELRFRCTVCGSTTLEPGEEELSCPDCGTIFVIQDGIYNFKVPCAMAPGRSSAQQEHDGSDAVESSYER